MDKKFYPRSKSNLIAVTIYLGFTLLVFAIFAGMGIFKDPVKWFTQLKYSVDADISLLCFMPLLLFLLPAILFFIPTKGAYLEIGSTSFTLFLGNSWLTHRLKGKLYNTIEYSDITRAVYLKSPERIKISSKTHVTREIPLGGFSEKAEILALLQDYLGEKLILEKQPAIVRMVNVFHFIAIVAYLILLLIGPTKKEIAWNSALVDSVISDINLQAFSFDEDGQSIWIVDDKSFSNDRRIWKVRGENIQIWKGLEDDYHTVQVSHDGRGQPILIKENEIIYQQNDVWVTESLGDNGFIFSYEDRPVVIGTKFWRITGFNIASMDFATGETTLLPKPNLTNVSFLDFRTNPDGSLLVQVFSDNKTYLIIFRDGHWVEPRFLLDDSMNVSSILDYCLDANGIPWMLRYIGESYEVGHYSSEKNGWDWISLNPYAVHDEEFSALVMDQRGRLWLQGDIEFDDFVRVYEVLPQGLYEIIEYDEHNSNFRSDFPITLGPDGKIWSADDTLAWIDGNAPFLPKPLPDWIAVFGRFSVKMAIQLFFIAVMFLSLLVQTKYNR